jgi:hypothetical protein
MSRNDEQYDQKRGSEKLRIAFGRYLTTGREPLHHAQAAAVLDHARALPQGDGGAGPAFAGGAEGGERNLIVFDAGDVLE